MTTANYYALTMPPQADQELTKARPRATTKPTSFTRPKPEGEPETRLWKICAEAAPPRLNRFEWTALIIFGASAILSLAFCASEWFHLFDSGALDQIARAVLTR